MPVVLASARQLLLVGGLWNEALVLALHSALMDRTFRVVGLALQGILPFRSVLPSQTPRLIVRARLLLSNILAVVVGGMSARHFLFGVVERDYRVGSHMQCVMVLLVVFCCGDLWAGRVLGLILPMMLQVGNGCLVGFWADMRL